MSTPLGPWVAREPRRRLSVDAIVAAGLEILAADGVDAVTMRAVAGRLDTGPASLYGHVKNKADLHALLLDAVIGEVEVPPGDPARWKEQLKEIIRSSYDAMLRHPGVALISMAHIPTGPQALRVTEGLLAALLAGGLSPLTAGLAMDLLTMYATAVAYEDTMWRVKYHGSESPVTEEEMVGQVRSYFAGLSPQLYPLVSSMADDLTGADGEQRFEFGLEVLLAGLEQLRDYRLVLPPGHQQVHDQPGDGGGQQE